MRKTEILKKLIPLIFMVLLPSFLLSDALNGEEVYKKKCLGCHGTGGTTPAFGISRKLVDLTKVELKDKLKSYTAPDVVNSKGVTAVMGKQTAKLNKQEYDDVLEYITSFASED